MRVMRNIYINTIFFTAFLFSFFSCTTQATLVEDEVSHEEIVTQPLQEEQEAKPEEVVIETPSKTLDEEELKEAETDIAELIEKLNTIISSKNFIKWKEYLSNDYIMYYSDPEVLKERSKTPLLIKNKIVLRSIEDYFNYVVVGSRQNVKLDEIKVLDRDRIKAYMFINNTPVIIYELIRIEDTWKIGKFLE